VHWGRKGSIDSLRKPGLGRGCLHICTRTHTLHVVSREVWKAVGVEAMESSQGRG
jgi:hypothetical protein